MSSGLPIENVYVINRVSKASGYKNNFPYKPKHQLFILMSRKRK